MFGSVQMDPIESGIVDYVSHSMILVRNTFISAPGNENPNSTTRIQRWGSVSFL